MKQKRPDLTVAKETIDFLERILNPNSEAPSELYMEVREMLRSVEGGFNDKACYPEPEEKDPEPEVYIYEGAFTNGARDWEQISKSQYDNWTTLSGCQARRRLKVDGFASRAVAQQEIKKELSARLCKVIWDTTIQKQYNLVDVIEVLEQIDWKVALKGVDK